MSKKRDIKILDQRLSEGHDLILKGMAICGDVKDELNDLMESDLDKSNETTGVVSTNLEKRAHKLSAAIDIIDDSLDEIETFSGEIFYALQGV